MWEDGEVGETVGVVSDGGALLQHLPRINDRPVAVMAEAAEEEMPLGTEADGVSRRQTSHPPAQRRVISRPPPSPPAAAWVAPTYTTHPNPTTS